MESEHSAERFGNAGVRVLATPILCHWFEWASLLAVADHLEPGEATVGTRLSIEHLKATPVGMLVRVEAEVTGVEGRRLAFTRAARTSASWSICGGFSRPWRRRRSRPANNSATLVWSKYQGQRESIP